MLDHLHDHDVVDLPFVTEEKYRGWVIFDPIKIDAVSLTIFVPSSYLYQTKIQKLLPLYRVRYYYSVDYDHLSKGTHHHQLLCRLYFN